VLVDGHLALGASSRGGLMLRVDPADTESLVAESGVTRFEMRGRQLDGWLHVAVGAVEDVGAEDTLGRWVGIGVTRARSLPPREVPPAASPSPRGHRLPEARRVPGRE
ncbi:MAG: hypothetical protein ABI776_04920, partial [Nocardioidaceae bacterium]